MKIQGFVFLRINKKKFVVAILRSISLKFYDLYNHRSFFALLPNLHFGYLFVDYDELYEVSCKLCLTNDL